MFINKLLTIDAVEKSLELTITIVLNATATKAIKTKKNNNTPKGISVSSFNIHFIESKVTTACITNTKRLATTFALINLIGVIGDANILL
ncbi:hypothetical protein D3C76_1035580 [compost metagenome]